MCTAFCGNVVDFYFIFRFFLFLFCYLYGFRPLQIDGKCLACTFGAKFIEVSVGINHNCDELLAGTLTQIRLKKDHNLLQVSTRLLT